MNFIVSVVYTLNKQYLHTQPAAIFFPECFYPFYYIFNFQFRIRPIDLLEHFRRYGVKGRRDNICFHQIAPDLCIIQKRAVCQNSYRYFGHLLDAMYNIANF